MRNILFLLSFCGLTAAQQLTPSASPQQPAHQVRLLALGHARLATFVKSKSDKIINAPSIEDGKMSRTVIPAGSPIEIRGKEFEYLPQEVFIKSKDKETTAAEKSFSLLLNGPGYTAKIAPRETLSFLLSKSVAAQEKPSFKEYFSAKLSPESTHSLVALVANPKEQEQWLNPLVFTFNVSPQVVPLGSLFTFNATPYPVELSIPLQGAEEPMILEPYSSKVLKPGVDTAGYTRAIAKLVDPKSNMKHQFYRSSFLLPSTERTFMCIHFDPRPNAETKASVITFTDKIE